MRPVVFDFDGVLVESEPVWAAVRRDVALAHGGTWRATASSEMQGLSTPEWTAFMVGELHTRLAPAEVGRLVIDELHARLAAEPPFLPGAVQTVQRLAAAGTPLAVASSSPGSLLRALLHAGGIHDCFSAIVSSEEVANGKPSPDVYLEAAARLGADAGGCLAVEDSTAGLCAAAAAGMEVWAVPNPHDPPAADALALATRTGRSIAELFGP